MRFQIRRYGPEIIDLNSQEGLQRFQQVCAGPADPLGQLLLELWRQQQVALGAGLAEHLATKTAVVAVPPHRPVRSGHQPKGWEDIDCLTPLHAHTKNNESDGSQLCFMRTALLVVCDHSRPFRHDIYQWCMSRHHIQAICASSGEPQKATGSLI